MFVFFVVRVTCVLQPEIPALAPAGASGHGAGLGTLGLLLERKTENRGTKGAPIRPPDSDAAGGAGVGLCHRLGVRASQREAGQAPLAHYQWF